MGNTEEGVKSFVPKCTQCHTVEDTGKQKIRPNLQSIWEEDTPGTLFHKCQCYQHQLEKGYTDDIFRESPEGRPCNKSNLR